MNIIFRVLLSLPFLFLLYHAEAQTEADDFIKYLFRIENHKSLKIYKKHIEQIDTIKYDADLLNYFLGKSYYQQQLHDSSNVFLSQVNDSSKIPESRFLIGINAVLKNDFKAAKKVLDTSSFSTDELINLQYLQIAGISLLERDYESYKKFDNSIYKDYYFFENERKSLAQIENDLSAYQEKSPFLAGLYSAILPGAGKFYAGKKGQGIYSFVISSLLALQAIESYQKAGPASARFIIYGGLFSLFHVGNVWSSALSVKKYNDEFYEAVDYRIKLDLHLPIRSFFN